MPVGRLRSQPRRKEGEKAMVFGLLCAADGCPVAVEVFPGNTADPTTLAAQVRKIRDRFGVRRVALVGDRGMITSARIRTDLLPVGLDWISALRTVDLRKLLKAPRGNPAGAPLLPRHWSTRWPKSSAPSSPANASWSASTRGCASNAPASARICCGPPKPPSQRSPRPPASTGPGQRTETGPCSPSADRPTGIRWRNTDLTVTDDDLQWSRNREKIKAEARLDGIYVIRTNLDTAAIDTHAAVAAYKSLSQVERAFRSMKMLHVRPVFVYTTARARACVPLPAGLVPGMAPAPASGTLAVRG